MSKFTREYLRQKAKRDRAAFIARQIQELWPRIDCGETAALVCALEREYVALTGEQVPMSDNPFRFVPLLDQGE